MQVQGSQIHIAGSAKSEISPDLLQYGHVLIEALVRILVGKGAKFLVGVGKEPHLEGKEGALPMIFDWTVIATIIDCLKSGMATPMSWQGEILTTVATQKLDAQIPGDRRGIWQEIQGYGAVQVKYIEPGWASGAVRRARMTEFGDVLIILSGGEGVEHLAREYALQAKPVIPIDLDLGSSTGDGTGGASRLAGEMLAHPDRFFRFSSPSATGELLANLATRHGQSPADQVAQGIVDLIEAIEPPRGFYVRLLARDHNEYPEVERFFRNVVDPLIQEMGYEKTEMGLSVSTHAWMNAQIFDNLHNCIVAVVDLTGLRSDCLIEFGYALGRSRRIILTAKKGTSLPFDSKMIECYFWEDNTPDDERLSQLKEYWRRNINRPSLVMPREIL